MLRFVAIFAGFAMLLGAEPARAQDQRHISIGYIHAKETCRYFREYEGAAAAIATPRAAAFAAAWRSWIVKDCENQFATLRASLESALASTGRFAVGRNGYKVSMSLSGISESDQAPRVPVARRPGEYHIGQSWISVALDVTVEDERGRVIFGGPLLKQVRTGFAMSTQGEYVADSRTGDAVYGELQQEVALAVARLVTFRIDPLKVTGMDGTGIRTNYGSPLLKQGAIVEVETDNGARRLRYRVTSANADYALAEMDGDNHPAGISVGAHATLIEQDDPAANGRRYRRVSLP